MNFSLEVSQADLLNEAPLAVLKEEYKKLYDYNKELIDSIYYAASVQQGLLPHERHFKRCFENFFILYKPQQIIGGDLYWVGRKNNRVYFAIADCTGHGVSGALLSVLAVSFLNYLILGKATNDLGSVLAELDKKWLETFNYSADYLFDNDWMEISLASFDLNTRLLRFSGAKSKINIIHNNRLITLKGDNYPIGGWQIERNRKFTQQEMFLEPDTQLFLNTDGFQDQIGGPKNKRITSSRLNNFLLSMANDDCQLQKFKLETLFEQWKGNHTQTDDMCIMGIKL